MQTVTWSCALSRSAAAGSRWPGTGPGTVVAAVSSVTLLLRAGIRRRPLHATYRPRAIPGNAARRPPPDPPRPLAHPPRPGPSQVPAAAPARPWRRPPGPSPDAMKPGSQGAGTARIPGFTTSRQRAPRQGARASPRHGLGLLGLPEDLVDLLDLGQQLVRLGHVHAALGTRRPGELGGLVEQLVQLGVLLEVRRLEVVGPQHPQVVLDQLGALLLDQDRPGAEVGVVVVRDLGDDGLDRLGLDAGLGGVVDSARQVA